VAWYAIQSITAWSINTASNTRYTNATTVAWSSAYARADYNARTHAYALAYRTYNRTNA
jgi:hypothetical protein